MLLKHTEFLANVSPYAARRLVSDFRKGVQEICRNPFLFPFADDMDVPGMPPETYRKYIFGNRYKTLYLVEGQNIFIDAIIDCRRENANLMG
jgi:plasmid stabilization system protein ParE